MRSAGPEAWAQACLGFRRDISARFRHGFPRSLVALVGMLVADLAILTLCLRFVGVDHTEVGLLEIGIAYLFAYPFTIFPFSGIGVVDALVLAALVEAGGIEIEAACVAALLVWRVFTRRRAGPDGCRRAGHLAPDPASRAGRGAGRGLTAGFSARPGGGPASEARRSGSSR